MSTQEEKKRLELLHGTLDVLILQTPIFGAARAGHRARHSTNIGRRVARGARRAASGSAPFRGARVDFREVRGFIQQSRGAGLFATSGGGEAVGEGNDQVEAAGGGWTDSRSGSEGGLKPCSGAGRGERTFVQKLRLI